jgi:hypothetical protein
VREFLEPETKSDYSKEAKSRNMRNIDEKDYVEEVLENEMQNEEDDDEAENQSPIVGKMSGTMEDLERIQGTEFTASDEVRECLKDSLDCYQVCTETTIKCLAMGGKHSTLEHLNLLKDCAAICSTNADFILRNSTYYPQICGTTADICDECADTCDRFEDDFMRECANACRRCAESCRELAR